MSNLVQDKDSKAFIETECIFKHNDKAYESGGSYLLQNKKTGKLEGILYSHNDETIGIWDGSKKVKAHFGKPFRTNFGQNARYVWFTWDNKKFVGINRSIDWQDIYRVREIK